MPIPGDGSFDLLRREMVESQLRSRGITDRRVLEVMGRVPRHEFIPDEHRGQSYEDHPLPIGEGQTISQPYIVALMLELLALTPTDRVLEVGAGSGYVTALLAELTAQVFAVERHRALATNAQLVLGRMGYSNAQIILGDGCLGLPAHAPFDAILVSAGAVEIPLPLIAQLKDGGRLIIPVGPPDSQQLQLIHKENGSAAITLREPCRFVPLVSGV